MKLTKAQKNELIEFGWDVVESETDGEIQNCSWINIDSEDGIIYNDALKLFGLSGDGKDIKLLVVGTREESEED